jgi:hypothetical protein
MEPQISQALRRPSRHEPTVATSLVECAVQVSPNLARLIRKCAVTEAGGASARNALLASAGLRANEVEELRDHAKLLAEQLEEKREIAEQLQRRLNATEVVAVERDQERIKLRRHLKKAAETEQESRQTAAALKAQIAQLQMTIVGLEDDLRRSISTEGLDERTALALKTFKNRLSPGEDIKTAALGIAGYELLEIEDAIAKQGRAEIRALDALLIRPSWRRSIVLRLLNVGIMRRSQRTR